MKSLLPMAELRLLVPSLVLLVAWSVTGPGTPATAQDESQPCWHSIPGDRFAYNFNVKKSRRKALERLYNLDFELAGATVKAVKAQDGKSLVFQNKGAQPQASGVALIDNQWVGNKGRFQLEATMGFDSLEGLQPGVTFGALGVDSIGAASPEFVICGATPTPSGILTFAGTHNGAFGTPLEYPGETFIDCRIQRKRNGAFKIFSKPTGNPTWQLLAKGKPFEAKGPVTGNWGAVDVAPNGSWLFDDIVASNTNGSAEAPIEKLIGAAALELIGAFEYLPPDSDNPDYDAARDRVFGATDELREAADLIQEGIDAGSFREATLPEEALERIALAQDHLSDALVAIEERRLTTADLIDDAAADTYAALLNMNGLEPKKKSELAGYCLPE